MVTGSYFPPPIPPGMGIARQIPPIGIPGVHADKPPVPAAGIHAPKGRFDGSIHEASVASEACGSNSSSVSSFCISLSGTVSAEECCGLGKSKKNATQPPKQLSDPPRRRRVQLRRPPFTATARLDSNGGHGGFNGRAQAGPNLVPVGALDYLQVAACRDLEASSTGLAAVVVAECQHSRFTRIVAGGCHWVGTFPNEVNPSGEQTVPPFRAHPGTAPPVEPIVLIAAG